MNAENWIEILGNPWVFRGAVVLVALGIVLWICSRFSRHTFGIDPYDCPHEFGAMIESEAKMAAATDRDCPCCGERIEDMWAHFGSEWVKTFECPHCLELIAGEASLTYSLRPCPPRNSEGEEDWDDFKRRR